MVKSVNTKKSVNTNKVEMDKKAAIAVVFENPEFGKIRTLTDEDGEPLFCAKDVCDALGYKRARCAVYQRVNAIAMPYLSQVSIT